MRNLSSNARRGTAAALTFAALAGTSLLAASPASALSYKCTTSTKSIDNPAYSGPWADNWDIKISLCSARSGSTVYSYAKASWDGPVGEVDDTSIFNGAYLRIWIAKSVAGTDPVVRSGNYYGIEAKLENSDYWGNYNNSYTTPTISYPVGSAKAYVDGQLKLEWRNDGKGYLNYDYSASPTV
ncbi:MULTISPECIES: hypothetical protein [Streptomyces]|uniref:hypothetical protein n=1 Tax=Streptomyces TaxID=1883 RepID=UPI00139EADFE|nr:hypothetical protein [Streptomyces diastatochromogenes]MYT24868.1 hypothetical protein [Streptomyces sp. SID7760]